MLYLSKQPAKTKHSKFTGEHDPRTPSLSRVPVIGVKTEPIDMDEGLKGLSSPIVISSSENEDPTPKARPGKGKNFPSTLTKQDFSCISRKNSSSVKPAPRPTSRPVSRKKDNDAEEPATVVDLPGSIQLEPLSETTAYLDS